MEYSYIIYSICLIGHHRYKRPQQSPRASNMLIQGFQHFPSYIRGRLLIVITSLEAITKTRALPLSPVLR